MSPPEMASTSSRIVGIEAEIAREKPDPKITDVVTSAPLSSSHDRSLTFKIH
jgi:hypothetical protein